ncbi:MAG: hypothetical protein GY937_16815 [bacterium]|nr:hypothetical protein [bacterium]
MQFDTDHLTEQEKYTLEGAVALAKEFTYVCNVFIKDVHPDEDYSTRARSVLTKVFPTWETSPESAHTKAVITASIKVLDVVFTEAMRQIQEEATRPAVDNVLQLDRTKRRAK